LLSSSRGDFLFIRVFNGIPLRDQNLATFRSLIEDLRMH